MKELFKVLTVTALVAALSVSMISCDDDKQEKDNKATAIVEEAADETKEETSVAETQEDKEEPAKEELSSGNVSIEPVTVFDKGGIKLTITGYEVDEFWGDQITYTVENNSDKDITISGDTTIINGFVVTDSILETVAAGKKANGEFSINKENFVSAAGIIEMYLNIYDDNTYEDIFEEEYIKFETSAAASVDMNPEIPGEVLYDENGIRILSCGMEYEELWGYEVKVYIENNSGNAIVCGADKGSVNDIMFDAWLYDFLPDGSKCFDTITLYESDIEENNIEEIEKVEVSFELSDFDNFYETIDSFSTVIYEK